MMKLARRFAAMTAIAGLTACASDPAARSQVAAQESARLPAPTTPLSAYGKFQLQPIELGPDVARDAAKAAVAKDLETSVRARLNPLLDQWNAQGATGAAAGKTLAIQPRAVAIRIVSGGARFFAGAFAGDSNIDMDLELRDVATGAVIANPRINRQAGAFAGAWTVGATDRNLLDYIADIAARYLQDNRK